MTLRKVLKILPVILLLLALIAGCAKHAQQPQTNSTVTPTQFAKANPADTIGATDATLFFLNNQLGWVAVNNGNQQPTTNVVLQTSDGGHDWVKLNSPGTSFVQQLDFADAYHGWALVTTYANDNTTHLAIMATADGGNTWKQQWSNNMQQLGQSYQMQFLSANIGFFLAGNVFATTSDGGAIWTMLPIAQGMSGFSFISKLTGWAVGANSIWSTTDGGVTWHRQWTMPDSITSQFLGGSGGSISFVSPTSGWACFQCAQGMFKSTKLFLYTDDGGNNWSITSSSYLQPSSLANLPPNAAPPSTAPCFVPASTTTALLAESPPTDYPVLCRTTDKGSDWETLSDGMSSASGLPQGSWGDLSFINANEGWAAVIVLPQNQPGSSQTASNVTLLHTVDGGQAWTTQYP